MRSEAPTKQGYAYFGVSGECPGTAAWITKQRHRVDSMDILGDGEEIDIELDLSAETLIIRNDALGGKEIFVNVERDLHWRLEVYMYHQGTEVHIEECYRIED